MDYIEVHITADPPVPFLDILISEMGEIGYESFEEDAAGFNAYITKPEFNEDDLKERILLWEESCKISYTITEIASQNWNAVWESNYEPVLVEHFCYVHAPFHKPKPEIPYNILIEPKMSFGTAHHPTTYLMLSFLEKLDIEQKKILDMGCGTGVLAILSGLKKAKHITAIDNDKWAYENTLENVANNQCASSVEVLLGDASLLKDQSFDIIFANINRNILLNDIPYYTSTLPIGGILLLSGFFESDIPAIEKECTGNGLKLEEVKTRNEWVALKFSK